MRLTKKLIGIAVIATMLSNNPTLADRWLNSVKQVLNSGTAVATNVTQPVSGAKSDLIGYSKTGQALIWRTCDKVEVWVNDGGSEEDYKIIESALNRASEISGVDFTISKRTNETPVYEWYNRGGIPPVIIGVVDQSNLLESANALGTTVANPAGSNIVTGAIALRKSYFDTQSREKKYEVTLHEIGHLIGLKHSDEPTDLMYRSTNSVVKQDFSDEEIAFFKNNKSCINR